VDVGSQDLTESGERLEAVPRGPSFGSSGFIMTGGVLGTSHSGALSFRGAFRMSGVLTVSSDSV
jgi:hypothetical protein